MGSRVSTRVRLSGVAFLMAMAAGCGGGGGVAEPVAPAPPPVAPPPASGLLDWDVHPAATVALGQATPDSSDPTNLSQPSGGPAVTADGRLFVADGNLKAFDNYAGGGLAPQHDIAFSGSVHDVSVRENKVVIAHGDGVAIYNDASTIEEDPDVFSSGINGCAMDTMISPQSAYLAPSGHLIVADTGNHRVLIWNPDKVPQTGQLPGPSVVVGQEDPDTCEQNAGGGTESRSEFTLNEPQGVWSDGTRLVVADKGNHRVLIWNQLPSEHFQPASHVLGQANFDEGSINRGGDTGPSAATLCEPRSVDVNEFGQMAVADSCNHRVLVWDSVPRADSVAANHVLGQNGFDDDTHPATPNSRNLNSPSGARFHKRNLIVVDSDHNRVVVFPASN